MELTSMKGLGPKSQVLLNKLGIYQVEDFMSYYPFRYELIKRSNISELGDDSPIIMDGIIESVPVIRYFHRRMDRMSFQLNSGTDLFGVTIFNRSYLKNKLPVGTKITVLGKYKPKNHSIVASDLRLGLILQEHVESVYHTTSGISNKTLQHYIDLSLEQDLQVVDYIPQSLVEKYQFLEKRQSILEIHHPTSLAKLKLARRRLKYEELFLYMLKMNYLRMTRRQNLGIVRDTIQDFSIQQFIDQLPFSLTVDQLRSIQDILADLKSPYQMNRLVQGDVGSGKTIVAIIAMFANYLSGYQSAFMAPTELLARQHYQTLQTMLQDYEVKIALLTGKQKAKERRMLLQELQTGKIDILVGTHALISDDVQYVNLGLVITDEQHRFGVQQRTCLRNKGVIPDILSMSATPIPRTFALTVYGDMDVSNIHTKPEGRKEVMTLLKKSADMKEVLTLMLEQLKQKHQIYVISPLIEEEEEGTTDVSDVKTLAQNMAKAFGKYYKIGVLHGKLSAKEKESVMEQYQRNEIQILISTTVIEVGVDVANATMMVIFDAYRFGLATLHQLRGRVGRNELQSYCLLISDKEAERLEVLTQTTDGFRISEEDFRLRGSGDLFGVRQSGEMVFQLADLKRDFSMVVKAKEDSWNFLNSKEYVNKKYDYLRKKVESSSHFDS